MLRLAGGGLERRSRSGGFLLVYPPLNLVLFPLLFDRFMTYQTEVDFHRGGNENRPAEPGCIVGDDHALPDVDSANGAGDVDDNSQTEDRDDGKTLAGGQLEPPDQRHWQGRDQEIGEDVDDTGGEDDASSVQAFVWIRRADIPVRLDGAVHTS